MAEYELVHEIQNLCRNNQMRDIFFDEIETDDPIEYVRQLLKGKAVELSVDAKENGAVTVYASVDGLTQKFVFTPILREPRHKHGRTGTEIQANDRAAGGKTDL